MPPINNLLNHFLGVLITLGTFFVLVFAYTKLAGPIPFDINSVTTSKSDAFSVTGEGKVEAKPDSATVRLGVSSTGTTAQQAKSKMNEVINKVTEAIKELGVEEKNIKTENFNVYPDYDNIRTLPAETMIAPVPPKDPNSKATSYSGNTNIEVTVNNAELANKVVDVASANGANQIGGVDFQVKDKEAALNQAREMAVKDAKKKAEDAARIAGFKLGKVINYSEGQNGVYPPVYAMKAEDARAGGEPTQIQPGTNEIMITVTLSYEIR